MIICKTEWSQIIVLKVITLMTERLKLRQWIQEDYPYFAKLNADTEVMEFYPSVLSETESNTMAIRIKSLIEENTWGFWAIELIETKQFIGFVGLNSPSYNLPITPCVEIGWRLAKEHWGKGYATEAGKATLKFAFEELDLGEVYSFASVDNQKSVAVMKRLGLKNGNNNFEHPILPEGDPLKEHVLYRITQKRWRQLN